MAKGHFVASAKGKIRGSPTAVLPQTSLVEREGLILWHGDAMDFLSYLLQKGRQVHLVLTSPPYNVGINYGKHRDSMEWREYLEWLTSVFSLCYKLLCSGGRIVLNVPYMARFGFGKRHFPACDYQKVLEESDFELIDMVFWVKARDEKELKAVAGRSTAWGSWKSVKSPRMRPVVELLLIGKKKGQFPEEGKPDISDEEFKNWTCSAWLIPTRSHPHHPAVFPEELVKRVVKLYTTTGQWILDPFMGTGTCGRVALSLGRRFAGAEIEGAYFLEALRGIE